MVKGINKKFTYFSILLFILFPFTIFNISYINNNNSNSSIRLNVLADKTPNIDFDDLPDIPYETLNDMWYNPKIEMIIITPEDEPYKTDFSNAVKPLVNWKNEKGVKTIVLNNYSLYGNGDDAENIRNMIKYYYETEEIRWVLLCGDAESGLIPTREVYNNDVGFWGETENLITGDTYKPTDYYYADLTGTWDDYGIIGNYGESEFKTGGKDEIDWIPEVYVGRLPAGNAIELEQMINKTLKYETDPYIGDWMNQMLLAGGISDFPGEEGDVDGEDESRLTTYIWQHYTQHEMNFTHLANYNSAFYTPPGTHSPLDRTSFNNSLTSGYSTILFAGHGDVGLFTDKQGIGSFRTIYTSDDAMVSANIDMPSLIYADACKTSTYDVNDNNIGEILIKRPNSGAIGYIGGLRVTWYMPNDIELEIMNRGNAKLFWEEFFQNQKFQQGRALYDSKVTYINSNYYQNERVDAEDYDEPERKNLLTYCLLGDPEVDIYTDLSVNATNLFQQPIYEGQLITSTVTDINGMIIPYAKVHLESSDGKYRTIYADSKGELNYRLPNQPFEFYNVIITGHNLIPSRFNFITLPDINKPDFDNENCSPKDPTVSDNLCFEVEVQDRQSGIENVYLLQSNEKDFKRYTYYKMTNRLFDEEDNYEFTIHKLEPGKYYFLVVARDWANNKEILEDKSFIVIIQEPLMNYVLLISSLILIAIAGITIFIVYQGRKRYNNTFNRLELNKI